MNPSHLFKQQLCVRLHGYVDKVGPIYGSPERIRAVDYSSLPSEIRECV